MVHNIGEGGTANYDYVYQQIVRYMIKVPPPRSQFSLKPIGANMEAGSMEFDKLSVPSPKRIA